MKTIEVSETTAKMMNAMNLAYQAHEAAFEAMESYLGITLNEDDLEPIHAAYNAFENVLWMELAEMMHDSAVDKPVDGKLFTTI